MLIASNSGRNAYPVELAQCANEKGAKVAVITSVIHASATTSWAKSKKKLMDIADGGIDNCGVLGKACLKMEGMDTL